MKTVSIWKFSIVILPSFFYPENAKAASKPKEETTIWKSVNADDVTSQFASQDKIDQFLFNSLSRPNELDSDHLKPKYSGSIILALNS